MNLSLEKNPMKNLHILEQTNISCLVMISVWFNFLHKVIKDSSKKFGKKN